VDALKLFPECCKNTVTFSGLQGLQVIFRIDAHESCEEWETVFSHVSSIFVFLKSREPKVSTEIMNAWHTVDKGGPGPLSEKMVISPQKSDCVFCPNLATGSN
jgi:hypothetical protein